MVTDKYESIKKDEEVVELNEDETVLFTKNLTKRAQGTIRDNPPHLNECGDAAFTKATLSEMAQWLGPQAYVLKHRGEVQLMEIFCGHGRLSEAFEKDGGITLRIGYKYGHDLDE